jgi:hypothetical protein
VNWGRRNGEVDVPSFAGKIFWGAFREMEQNLEGGRLAEGLAAVSLSCWVSCGKISSVKKRYDGKKNVRNRYVYP